jgi:hypothetical protein
MPRTTPLASLAATLTAVGLLVAACSSTAPDTSLEGAGGGGASSPRGGSGGKGGSSSGGSIGTTGGSANSTSSGGSTSGGSTGTATGGSANSTSSGGFTTGGSANSTSSGGSGAYPTDACEGLPSDNGGQGGDSACTGVSTEAEPVPVDLFFMMDRSVSMGNLVSGSSMTRWEALEQAVEDFTQSTSGGDIRAGLGFFGITGGNDDEIDCNQGNYAKPVVAIDTLDKSGPAIVSAMSNMVPGGLTPSGPALSGALDYAASWAKAHPGRAMGVVLVSDGYPTQCQPQSVSDLAAIAEQAHQNAPYVRTFVIGLGGDFNLDAIALSGGTHAAFKVDEGDISGSFSTALANVTNSKLACEYTLPPPPAGNEKLDLTRVQVIYSTPGDASTEEIPAITGVDACANAPNGGWYYDDPKSPTSILVCPCTCSRFEAGRVDVRVGCRPAVGPR